MADAPTEPPERDRETRQGASKTAGGDGPGEVRRAAFAGPGKSGWNLAAPLAAGAAAGATAGIVNTGAGAIAGILAGAAAGIAAALIFRAIGRGRPRYGFQAEAAGDGRTGAEAAGDRVPEEMLQRAATELVRRLPAPAVLVDGRREIIAVSHLAEALLRRVAEGRPLPDSIRDPELLAAVQQAVRDGVEQEVTIRESVPQDRHLHALVAPLGHPAQSGAADLRKASGEPQDGLRGALILMRDLTPEIQADRMRVDLVANVSHELRTPLASLAGFLETLRGPAANDPAAQERFLRIMEEQTARMTRLVDSLMSLSNIEMEEHRPPTGRIELNTTVRSVVDALKIVAERLGKSIVVMHDLEPAEIAGDDDQISRVAGNLLENAIKYGRAGSAIEVRIFALGRYETGGRHETGAGEVAISVSDSGDGIPEEHLPRLTERFYRVDAARARRSAASAAETDGGNAAGPAAQAPDSGGAGLGLAIVKHIVARHGGRLEIVSELGVGSSFTAVFPAAAAAAPPHSG